MTVSLRTGTSLHPHPSLDILTYVYSEWISEMSSNCGTLMLSQLLPLAETQDFIYDANIVCESLVFSLKSGFALNQLSNSKKRKEAGLSCK